MDVVLDKLNVATGDSAGQSVALAFLEETLQCEGRDYATYFSSHAVEGTVVEAASEIQAQLSSLERELRVMLVRNKDAVSRELLGENTSGRVLEDLRKNLDPLWELDPRAVEGSTKQNLAGDSTSAQRDGPDKHSVAGDENDELFAGDARGTSSQSHLDEFHLAVESLRERVSLKEKNDTHQGHLMTILEHWDNIAALMELPFLLMTCIRTGHYQEAILLFGHTKTLQMKFPESSLVQDICKNVLREIRGTMLNGLVNLLTTNLTVNSIKKILKYVAVIPPFDSDSNKGDNNLLLTVYLSMRYKFIKSEIESYTLDNRANESLLEITLKRKIEVIREHLYSSINVYTKAFNVKTVPVTIPLNEELTAQDSQTSATTTVSHETSPLLLQFLHNCTSFLLDELQRAPPQALTHSICLQLVYCSFRLGDLNANYHTLFTNELYERTIYSREDIAEAIEKRSELATHYS
ncbi:Golgi transport complex subunit COG8 KNAG_0E04060 [Huiozyma naganishii CBS 8797]|uniref:Conserved oligomeric Golgi complex subunit 8 n=1 Tax=Huiozyma naganishii (strain ATCC MYA-139 / BCRC 22969 / CBS 8797 / KCTC 17520 / NBRC 10181 / NCYC 3082 / Yp74L-3) TaxID=1071383 RepID=J7S6Y2_HUIN7|nr:hypothetical protein KNAG_0E04060 [Kazachstania naganishii CBS 8797]CCK70659.1 hypothetical protein KNAG_0E04060 [Kazachstania naganishii CBS 8797]